MKEDTPNWNRPVMKNNQEYISRTKDYFNVDPEDENYKNSLQEDENGNDKEYFLDPDNDYENYSNIEDESTNSIQNTVELNQKKFFVISCLRFTD